MDIIPSERIVNRIIFIRGKKVMLDRDLAELYEVTTSNLNKAVKRNEERFPEDFMFQLTKEEYEALRFQFGTLKRGQHSKYMPHAFTEHGVMMLSNVLRSERAVKVSIQIVRAFVRLREMLATHTELRQKIEEMEKKYDKRFKVVFEAVQNLLGDGESKKTKKIGFSTE